MRNPTKRRPGALFPLRLSLLPLLLVFAPLPAQQAGVVTDDAAASARVAAAKEVVDELFRTFAEERDLPGLAWGIVHGGRLVASGGTGVANLAEGIPAGPRSLFRIASMSKSFTALAILQLRDEGRLSLDDPVARWVPEMREMVYPTGDAPEITIRHLLTHSAGFPEDNPWGDRQLADSDRELLDLVAAGPSFARPPGIAYEYSNLGFALLGQVVEAVSGLEFHEYTRRRIFEPLGMHDTVWEFTDAPPRRLALGYDRVDGAWRQVPHEHHGSFGAMGGLLTSVEDFAAWAVLHVGAWPPRDGPESPVLRRASLREMHQPWRFASLEGDREDAAGGGPACPVVRAYGYGLRWTRDCDDRTVVGHSGGLPGFGSDWALAPDYGLAVFSFDNRTYAGTASVNAAVLDTLVTLAGLEPVRPLASPVLELRKAQLAAFLPGWEGAGTSPIFADNFLLDNRLADLAAHTRALWEEIGPGHRVGPLEPWNRLRGTFAVQGDRGTLTVLLTLSPEPEPRIQQVVLRRGPP
ncbi:MAG: serine hydrolase domain-containing protein [Gemmatimonadota bacterium]|nr:serine hydrolase domain-containing protein [Gemmatimonadota bacterium]